MKTRNSGRLLIVPDHHGKTIEICLDKSKKVYLSLAILLIFSVSVFIGFRYAFYRDQVYALLNDQTLNSSSINQISNDGVQTKLDLMKLKAEIDLVDKFIASCAQMDNELRANLKIPHSNVTFADIFQQNSKNRPSSYPASSTEPKQKTQQNILESQQRQKSYQELMDRTPSGCPVKGLLISNKSILQGPGLVFKTSVGSLIHTTATGKVVSIREMQVPGFYTIEIEHPADVSKHVITRYLYCTRILVYEGQELNKGQVIGYTGLIPSIREPLVGYQLLINKMLIQP
jgi:murein DD-endopeptidase MepM/ murein hydrolase activator NlpD